MAKFEHVVNLISRSINWVAVIALVFMVLLTCANIIGRLFGNPIPGAFDNTELFAVIVAAFAMAYTQVMKGHVPVEIVTERISERAKAILTTITSPFLVALSVMATWQSMVYASEKWAVGEVSGTVHIPFYPYIYGMAFSFAVLTLVFITDFLSSLNRVIKK